MSVDIVEIALDSMTDAQAFEKLAAEIMREEGHRAIVPLGGHHDQGRDAIEENLFRNEGRVVTVFQFTLRHDIAQKIRETVEKLAANNIEYDELVFVTRSAVMTQKADSLIAKYRRGLDIILRIYERKVLVSRLADYSNGIFHRFFPSIEEQLQDVIAIRTQKVPEDQRLEKAKLVVCKALVLDQRAARVRKELFDRMVLSLMLADPDRMFTPSELLGECQRQLGEEVFEVTQIEASLKRLARRSAVQERDNSFCISGRMLERLVSVDISTEAQETSIVSDLVETALVACERSPSSSERQRLERNARDLLVQFFRLFGLDLSNQLLGRAEGRPVYQDATPALLGTARRSVPRQVGSSLVAAVGEALANPTPEQAEFFSSYARSYLALQILNLDPVLRELQTTRLSTKRFILDTDFVVDCVVQEAPFASIFLRIVSTMQQLGCEVVVPDTAVREGALHARISPRTYERFGGHLLAMPASFVEQRVGNAFVKGYYYGKVNGVIPSGWEFERYLSNYVEAAAPEEFFLEVVRSALPDVTVTDVFDLLDEAPSEADLDRLTQGFIEVAQSSLKAAYRTKEEVEALAAADARLMHTVMQLNGRAAVMPDRVLGQACFLVTNSGRYLRCLNLLGIRNRVCSRPQVLIGLLELVGGARLDHRSFVSLFENPFLRHVVRSIWEHVKVLLEVGLDLQRSSLPRVAWDVEVALRNRITALGKAESEADQKADEAEETAGDAEYLALVTSATERGYPAVDPVKKVMALLKEKDEKIEELDRALADKDTEFQELEKVVTHFGKRRQRYIRRMKRRDNQKAG